MEKANVVIIGGGISGLMSALRLSQSNPALKVILLEKVENLGGLGEKVNVRNGYGRNFLIPEGKAVPATESNVAKFEARRR